MSFSRRLSGRTAALALLSWLLIALVLHLRAERQLSTHHLTDSGIRNPPLGDAAANPKSSNTEGFFRDGTGDSTRRTAVVVAKTAFENVTWLDEYFPQWEKNIYSVDDREAKLKIPKNKGRESMVYLRCVVVSHLCQ